MKVKFYSMSPFSSALLKHYDPGNLGSLRWDGVIRDLGYPSCRFVINDYGCYREMDELEYIHFVLSWT